MFVVAVANAKGGCGKTTVATHLAARCARFGFRTSLVDLDRQRAAHDWVFRRPASLPPIRAIHADIDELEVPRDSAYVIIDVPAGPKRKGLEAVVRVADLLLVPLQASAFDRDGTTHFLAQVGEHKAVRKGRLPVALIPNRVSPRGPGRPELERFLAGLGHPVVTRLAESPLYLRAAETGVTIFDQPEWRVRPRLAEWSPLVHFIHETITAEPS